MTATASFPPPLVHLDSQPDNLLAASDVANSSYVPPKLLTEVLDQEKARAPIESETKMPHSNGTNGTDETAVAPPLQPESKPVKDNKGVPW